MIVDDTSFSFLDLRKNACGYLVECGANDSEIGEVLGMSPETMRNYDARTAMLVRGAADQRQNHDDVGDETPSTFTKNILFPPMVISAVGVVPAKNAFCELHG